MTAQDLKNTILQLAMQGKLVPQDPADEPASELLKRICVKKNPRLIDKGTMPIDIPDSWQWSYISDVGELIRSSGIKRNETVDKGFPCVRYGELYTTYEIAFTETVSFIPESIFKHCKQITHGDLLMTLTGENKPDIAKTIAYIGTTPIAVGGDLAYWTKHGMNPLYLSYLMASPYAIEKKVELATGDRIVHISGAKLGTIPIPIPPLAEQSRIVAKIEELLPLVAEYDRTEKRLTALNRALPDNLRRSILQQAVMGKLTGRDPSDEPVSDLLSRIRAEKEHLIKEDKLKKGKPLPPISKDEIPFDIPEGWAWAYLDDLVIIRGGKRMPKGKQLLASPTDHIYVRVTDMQSGTILDNDLHYVPDDVYPLIQKYIIEKSDIYLVIVGSTIGKTGLVPEMFDGMNLTENAVRLTPIIIYKEFLYLVLDSAPIQQQFSEKIKQEGQPKLAITRLRSSIVPLPPLAEQKRIVDRVEELLETCGQLR